MTKQQADAARSIAHGPGAEPLRALVTAELAGSRLDAAAAKLFPGFSRSRLQAWIGQGALKLNGAVVDRVREPVAEGDQLELLAPVEIVQSEVQAQDIGLTVLHADEHIAVIDKPAGLTVHPGAGTHSGTLQNALLHRFPHTAVIPRAGIVHRLDKDTSGILVVALSLTAHTRLVAALAAREIRREYDALVAGVLSGGGRVDASIGRHPRDRRKMTVSQTGRRAVSHYRVEERFRYHSHVRVRLETGRTHQIRVHMAHIKHPIVGDPVYSPKAVRGRGIDAALRERLQGFGRQALHARELGLQHPVTGESLQWLVEPPADMQALIAALRDDARRQER